MERTARPTRDRRAAIFEQNQGFGIGQGAQTANLPTEEGGGRGRPAADGNTEKDRESDQCHGDQRPVEPKIPATIILTVSSRHDTTSSPKSQVCPSSGEIMAKKGQGSGGFAARTTLRNLSRR